MAYRLIAVLLFAVAADAQTSANTDRFRKETASVRAAINEVVTSNVGAFALLNDAKSTYLENYGAVFTLEVALEQPRNPFMTPRAPAEVRRSVSQRRKLISDMVRDLLKKNTREMTAVPPGESIAVIMFMLNSNPADLPDLPTQLVITARRQDLVDYQGGRITEAEINSRIRVVEH